MSDSDKAFPDFGKLVPGFDFLQNLTRQASASVSSGLPQMPSMPSMGHWVAPTLSVEELNKRIQELNVPAIQAIRHLYDRGVAHGVFRAGLDPVDIHASISALTFFNVSNQYTFGLIFKNEPQSSSAIAARRDNVVEMVVRFVRQSN